eukprot:c19981_g1_i1.p1 GENE.c19981_g1_i1~~c19981_g1_i1.p1  ORF type:complete len:759 (-),score=136.66 c19981_g1_i1:870-3146(-)
MGIRDSKPESGMSLVSSVDLGNPLNSISISPNERLIAAGGRDTLQTIVVEGDAAESITLQIDRNLRKKRQVLSQSVSDIQWNPTVEHSFATAATNGAIVLWSTQRGQGQVVNAHTRSVNRLCWHPTDPALLLSASSDGTVKLWDTRTAMSEGVTMAQGRPSGAVHDVEFNPFNPNRFAAGYENGSLQIWDIRRPADYESCIAAQSLVFALSWHPHTPDRIATGGRDYTVKVWDTNKPSEPTHTLHTIASVARILWRPGYPTQIAITSQQSLPYDTDVQLWEITSPYVPIMTFSGHSSATPAVAWGIKTYSDYVFTASRDNTVGAHLIRRAIKPQQNLSVSPVCWGLDDSITASCGNINRDSDPNVTPRIASSARGPLTLPPPMEFIRNQVIYRSESLTKFSAASVDINLTQYFADEYILDAKSHSFEYCCNHNTKVALKVGRIGLAHSWHMLGQFFESDAPQSTWACNLETLKDTPLTVEEQRPADSKSQPNPTAVEERKTMVEFLNVPEDSDSDDGDAGGGWLWNTRTTVPTQPVRAPDSGDAVRPPGKFMYPLDQILALSFEETVLDLAEYYADQGDVQMCASLVILLRGRMEFPSVRVKQWFASYLDLLWQLQLWDLACEVVGLCPDEHVSAMNRRETTLGLGCGHCTNSLSSETPYTTHKYNCQTCASGVNTCAVCQTPVKGTYVWCRRCGHGGHLDHMHGWFESHTECPTGCQCNCNHGTMLGQLRVHGTNVEAGNLRVHSQLKSLRPKATPA